MKFKKPLCLNIFLKSSLTTFCSLLLFILAFFLLATSSVKANSNIVTYTSNAGVSSYNFTTNESGTLICKLINTQLFWSYFSPFFSLDSSGGINQLTNIYSDIYYSDAYHGRRITAYKTNVLAGNHTIYFNSDGGQSGKINCDLSTEITDFIATSTVFSLNANETGIAQILNTKDSLVMSDIYFTSNNGFNYPSYSINQISLASSSIMAQANPYGLGLMTNYFRSDNNSINLNLSLLPASDGGDNLQFFYTTWLVPSLIPPSTDYVQYNYSQGAAKIVGMDDLDPLNWSIHYNVCDTGYPPSGGNVYFSIVSEDGLSDLTYLGWVGLKPEGFIGAMNCQGDYIYQGLASNGQYGTSTVKILMTTVDADNNIIQEKLSSSFVVTQLPHIIDSSGFITYSGISPLNINTSNLVGSSTSISADYNICQETDWASGVFKLFNVSTNSYTDFQDVTINCSGVISFALPYVSGFTDSFVARFDYLNSSDKLQILGNQFLINFSSSVLPPASIDTVPNFCDEAGSNIVENTICFASKTVVQPVMGFLIKQISKFFPFNLMGQLYNSWNLSISAPLNPSLEWFALTKSNGDVVIPIPQKWTGNNNLGFTIWGRSIFSSNPDVSGFFSHIRSFTTYLFYFLFIFAVWRLGKQIYKEFRE